MGDRLPPVIAGARGLGSDERGFAVPTVMMMMLAAFAVVTVGVVASIHAQSGTVRDQASKTALTSAETGVTQALLAYNGGFSPVTSTPCLLPVTNPVNTVQPRATLSGGASAWCQAVTGSDGLGTYSYQVCPATTTHPCAGSGTIEIVSTGTYNGVTRRVDVVAKSASGQQIFFDAGVKSQTDIVLDSNAELHSTAAAGGSITLASTSTKACGIVQVGSAGTLSGPGQYYANPDCTGPLDQSTVTHNDLTLPPVNQGDAASNNDNCRITAAVTGVATCSGGDYRDLISGNKNDVTWDPTTRQLTLTGQKTSLTLTGKTYSLCRLVMQQNSTLYVAPSQGVSIFFDSPENCGLAPYNGSTNTTQKQTAQIWMESNTRITASSDPATLNMAIYVVGSQTVPTGILMSSNSDGNAACVQNFVVYAPLSTIEMNSNSTYCGAIAGQSIHLDQNARFLSDSISQSIVLPNTAPHYITSKFVDCSTEPASPPNAGC